jgi:hypothetical protein
MSQITETGWWSLDATCDLTDADREHIASLIRDGFTSGQIVHDDEDEEIPT